MGRNRIEHWEGKGKLKDCEEESVLDANRRKAIDVSVGDEAKWTAMHYEPFVGSLRECDSWDWYRFPEDHRSPHDSWVETITIVEPSSGERSEIRGLEIHIRLLSAYHDGTIELVYEGVQRYSISGIRDAAGHGDWLEDELKVMKHDSLLHKVTLTNGDFEIEAAEIEYRWTSLPTLLAH